MLTCYIASDCRNPSDSPLAISNLVALTPCKAHRQSEDAYQGFLTLCKDADPDIPILKEAKAEYAKLQ